MKLYAYCLVDEIDTLDVQRPGISGAAVRLLKIDDLSLLISELESDITPVTRENALDHAAVVRSVLDRATPLPFRFGSLGTEQQLRSYIMTHAAALKTKLAHVRGCIEMNLKIMWNDKNDREPQPQAGSPPGAGTVFLENKRREFRNEEQRVAQVSEVSALLQERLGGLLRDERIDLRPSKTVVLAAVAHLIEVGNIQSYREKAAEILENRPELRFLLSGPWPPYSFANIELEFKTQFGVS